jgi:hypothetical protein
MDEYDVPDWIDEETGQRGHFIKKLNDWCGPIARARRRLGLGTAAVLIASVITQFVDEATGEARITVSDISKACGNSFSERTIKTAIRKLAAAGFLTVEKHKPFFHIRPVMTYATDDAD